MSKTSCNVLGEFLSLFGPLLRSPATFGAGCLCLSLLWCNDHWDRSLQKIPVLVARVELSGAWHTMPSASGTGDRNLLGEKGYCSYVFTFVSRLMFDCFIPDHAYPPVLLNFKERKQSFCFVSLTWLNFLPVPAVYPGCFCQSNMPLFLNPGSPSWCPGLGVGVFISGLPQQNSLEQPEFIPVLPKSGPQAYAWWCKLS